MKITPFGGGADEAARWDDFVARAWNANFLHSRKFLSYHGEKFRDCSAWIESGDGKIAGVFPAAVVADENAVCSHPGATYGGVVHCGGLQGEAMQAALAALADYYRAAGFEKIIYKATPHIYHARPTEDDLYALFRADAVLTRRDLAAVVAPGDAPKRSQRRRRGLKKAQEASAQIIEGAVDAPFAEELWNVVRQNLAERHNVSPAHSWPEMRTLGERFASEIVFVGARIGAQIEGGVVRWGYPTAHHAQYIAATARGREACVLDLVFDHLLRRANQDGRWLSFGVSTENGGRNLNAGLHEFKSGFGGGAITHDFYELPLGR